MTAKLRLAKTTVKTLTIKTGVNAGNYSAFCGGTPITWTRPTPQCTSLQTCNSGMCGGGNTTLIGCVAF